MSATFFDLAPLTEQRTSTAHNPTRPWNEWSRIVQKQKLTAPSGDATVAVKRFRDLAVSLDIFHAVMGNAILLHRRGVFPIPEGASPHTI